MPDYTKGKLYLLECDGLIYVGSTVLPLSVRYSGHISDYKRNYYCASCKLIEKNKPINIILLLEYPCKSKKELEELEQYYIDEIDCVNDKRAVRTIEQKKEYYREYDKTDKRKVYKKEYYQKIKVKNIN